MSLDMSAGGMVREWSTRMFLYNLQCYYGKYDPKKHLLSRSTQNHVSYINFTHMPLL